MKDRKALESLFHLVHALKRELHSQAALLNVDITPMHIQVLKVIDHKQDCTAVDIAGFFCRDKAQVTRLISTLIEKGLLVKAPNPNDKRSHYLRITEAGDEVVAKIVGIDTDTIQKMTKSLSAKEVEEFQRIAHLMTENLTAD